MEICGYFWIGRPYFELMIVLSMGCSFWFLIKFLYIQLTSFIIEHFLHFFSAWYSYSLNFVLPIFTNRLCTKNIKKWAFLSPYTTHSLILDFFYAHRARLAVLGCLEKYLFTLFYFELRKAQKSHCDTVKITQFCYFRSRLCHGHCTL